MDKVYLDSNIIILGAKKKEHEILRDLSKDRKITLYISDHVNIELHGKVLPKLKEKDAALRIYDMLLPTGSSEIDEIIIDFVNKKRDSYHEARREEESDMLFWKGAVLMSVESMFSSLWAIGAIDPYLNSLINDELKKLEILMNYGIKGKDALHIIQAHCSSMNYFLTWDKPLIKKVQKIRWLNNLRIMTPEQFLKVKLG